MPRGERCQSKGILLPQDLIGDGNTELWPGMFQAEAGRGDTASVRSTRNDISDTVASNAISDKQGARKNALDNRQGTAVNRAGMAIKSIIVLVMGLLLASVDSVAQQLTKIPRIMLLIAVSAPVITDHLRVFRPRLRG